MTPILLSLPQVAEATGLSTRQIERLVAAGGFPAPRQASARRIAWLASEVEEWARALPQASRDTKRDTGSRGDVIAA